MNTGDKTKQNKTNYCLILCIHFIKQMMFLLNDNDCIRHHGSLFFLFFFFLHESFIDPQDSFSCILIIVMTTKLLKKKRLLKGHLVQLEITFSGKHNDTKLKADSSDNPGSFPCHYQLLADIHEYCLP